MIVRIATEGQYEVASSDMEELGDLDNDAVAACDAGEEQRFRAVFTRMVKLVRSKGEPVAEDDLRGSDLILPPPDASLEEAKAEFTGEGLIPG